MKGKKQFWKRVAAVMSSVAIMLVSIPTSQVIISFAEETTAAESSNTGESTSTVESEVQQNNPSEEENIVSLTGFVTVDDGVPVSGAIISLLIDETVCCTSADDGSYTLNNVPKSESYQIVLDRGEGFESETFTITQNDTNIIVATYYDVTMNVEGYNFYILNESWTEIHAQPTFKVKKGSELWFRVDSLNYSEQVTVNNVALTDVTEYNGNFYYILNIDNTKEIGILQDESEPGYDFEDDNYKNERDGINIIWENIPSGACKLYYANLTNELNPNEAESLKTCVENYSGTYDNVGLNMIDSSKCTVNVTDNGSYYFCFEDLNGKLSQVYRVDVDKIDKEAPTIKVESVVIKNNSATITISASDDKSGVESVYLSTSNGAASEASLSNGKYVFNDIKASDLNNICIIAEDKVGNRTPDENAVTIDDDVFKVEVSYDDSTWSQYKTINVEVNQEATVSFGKENISLPDENDSLECSFQVDEQGTYTLNAVNSNGIAASCDFEIGKIDTVAPVLTSINHDSNWKGNGSADYIVTGGFNSKNGKNDGSPITAIFYQLVEEGKDVDASNAKEIEKGIDWSDDESGNVSFQIQIKEKNFSGNCYVCAEDEVGNRSEWQCSSENIAIDSNPPVIESVQYTTNTIDPADSKGFIKTIANSLSFGLLYRDYVMISVTAHDDETYEHFSGISELQWAFVPYDPENADFDINVYDIQDQDWNKWDDISGFESEEQKVDIKIDTNELGNVRGIFFIRVKDQVAYSYAEIKIDPENEEHSETIYIILDHEKPAGPNIAAKAGEFDYSGGNWTKEDVIITLSGSETLSGVDHYEYAIDYADDTKTDKPVDRNTVNAKWTVIPVSNSITISEDTNATYYFRAVSNTGVVGEESSIYVTVQKTIPDNANVTIPKPNGKNSWFVNIPQITVEKPKVNSFAAPVTTYYALWNTQTGEKEPAGTVFNASNRPEISADGVYTLKVWTIDDAGNRCEQDEVRTIKVDTTAPEKQELYIVDQSVAGWKQDISLKEENTIVYRHIYQTSIEIQTAFDFDISGKEKIEYQKVHSFAVDDSKWTTYNEKTGLIVNPNEKFILAVRATDKAGNQTIIYSDGIIVDNEAPVGEDLAPEITITPDSPNANGYHNGDVGVGISVMDPPYDEDVYSQNGIYSGLNSVVYRVITDGVTTQEETLFSAGENPSDADLQSAFSANITVSSALNNSNNIFVEVVAVDRAGNERISRTVEGAIKIDTTAPTIRISYDNNSPDSTNVKYFKDARTATIEVTERNFNPDDVRLSLTNTDGVIPSISGWTTYGGTGNMDDTVHSATLTYSADGDYTFDIAYTDMADNPCREISYVSGTAAPQEFTIDRTAPVINVSYDNNSVKNGKYFSKARVATVVIQEHNFDSSRVKITATASRNGKSINIPSSNISWTGSGDNHTAVINYKEDGDYTFDIEFTDMAGNESDSANYGSSAAGKDFVVDTTIEKPEVTLNGEDGNGKAFKGDLKLAVSFGDINFDSYDIKLERVVKGEKPEDVTEQFINNLKVNGSSCEGTFDTFKKVQENDGIYTLIVTLTDKAGNSETTEVKFTVNRFGSVYEYSEYLVSLIADGGQYVKSLEDDLVITEYNADRLVEDSLSIVITKDGKPLENAECEVTPVINDKVSTGESGWYQYDYIISKDNFASDGVYKMVVSSEDEAGNTPENTNYDDKSVLFRVDSTAPELTSVTGLEKSIYNGQKLTVGYDVYDTIGLKSVKVYIDGNEVDQIADFNEDANNYNGSFDINESEKAQSVRLVVEDKAGNITDTDKEEFTSAYDFEKLVTVSTNIFVRWYANKPLFWSSIGGIGAVGIGAGLLIFIGKKKKKTA